MHRDVKIGFGILVGALILVTNVAHAGSKIEKACLKSDRKAVTRELCSCIQFVADQSLTRAQQSKGAKWFKDPHKAQQTRQSSRGSDEKMWQAWKKFSARTQEICGASPEES